MSINKPGLLLSLEQKIHLAQHWDNLYTEAFEKLPWRFNPFPKEVFRDFVEQLKGADHILDYGCGTGRYYDDLHQTGATITCVDISSVAIEKCGQTYPDAIAFSAGSAEKLPDNFFSGVLLWGVLHHIPPREREMFWRHLSKKVAPGGLILLGGWSLSDPEQGIGRRVSSITKRGTWNIDVDLERIIKSYGLTVVNNGLYPFVEALTQKNRIFSYYLLQRDD